MAGSDAERTCSKHWRLVLRPWRSAGRISTVWRSTVPLESARSCQFCERSSRWRWRSRAERRLRRSTAACFGTELTRRAWRRPPRPTSSLHHRKIHAGPRGAPIDMQRPARRRVVDRDGQSLGRRWRLADRHRDAGNVLRLVVHGAPLARLLVDDELPGLLTGKRVQRVRAGRQMHRSEHQHLVDLERCRLIGPRAPDLTRGCHILADRAAFERWPAVVNRDVRAVDGPTGADVRTTALARVQCRDLLGGQRRGHCEHKDKRSNNRGSLHRNFLQLQLIGFGPGERYFSFGWSRNARSAAWFSRPPNLD